MSTPQEILARARNVLHRPDTTYIDTPIAARINHAWWALSCA